MTTFDDGKEDGALRTIGEVGTALGLKPHVLRYWEEQFPMLDPLKRSGNRRYYRPKDVALVETIDRLVNHEGYTLKGAKQAIEEGRVELAAMPTAEPAAQQAEPESREEAQDTKPASEQAPARAVPADVIAELKDIRANLAAAVGA